MTHKPVMLNEMLAALAPEAREVHVDGTFGAGGYSRAILETAACEVVAIDRDLEGQTRAAEVSSKYPGRFRFVPGCFGDVEALLARIGVMHVDGFVLDVGVSSMQIDTPERGFSFRYDAALDMRMDRSAPVSAADLVNTEKEEDLADMIYRYGEERHSRKIARAIALRRAEQPFSRTVELADLVRSVVPKSRRDEIDPATRTFQALRIAVNDELGELERALAASSRILKPGGRIVVVTFHSLEDRLVKSYFKSRSGRAAGASRYLPEILAATPLFHQPQHKALFPDGGEIEDNKRARSARLRWAVRTDAPADCRGGA